MVYFNSTVCVAKLVWLIRSLVYYHFLKHFMVLLKCIFSGLHFHRIKDTERIVRSSILEMSNL